MTIWEFADIIDKQITITYHPNRDGRFSASFAKGEVKKGIMLEGTYGSGVTPMDAIINYIGEICGKRLVFSAMDDKERKEFVVPKQLIGGIL